jgi:hypothetical protein
MTHCNKIIKDGIIVRYILTIIVFYILSINSNSKFIKKYIFLILPLVLYSLDKVDNTFTFFYKYNKKYNGCTKTFYYQNTDKICDSVSYLLIFVLLALYFKTDYILLLIILYRIIGVILFYITKNSKWLIIFFDFTKEYLFYLFVFGNNYNYIPIFILCKIYYEYYFHTICNPNNYSKN